MMRLCVADGNLQRPCSGRVCLYLILMAVI